MSLKPNEITQFQVPDTGITLPVRKVSYVLVQDVQKQVLKEFPEPKPPEQTVDYGSGPELEKNYAHPNYVAAHEAWKAQVNEEMEERTRKLLIKLGVCPYLNMTEERMEQVKALREMLREEWGQELDKDDKYVWVTRIAMGTIEDWGDFTTYLMRRNGPTEVAIGESLKTV